MHVFLETARLRLRRFTEADVDNLFRLHNDPEVMRFINGGRPASLAEILGETLPGFMTYDRQGLGFWAAIAKSTGEFLGWFEFRPTAPGEAELGYRLRRQAWGQGYATEGALALIRKGFTELGLHRIFATTMAVNTASRHVMEKAGLTLVRTFHQAWPDYIPGAEQGDVEYEIQNTSWCEEILERRQGILASSYNKFIETDDTDPMRRRSMAEQKRKLTPEDLYAFINLSDPQISPDGEVIAYVRTHIDSESKEPRSAIWLVAAAGGAPVQFTRSNKSDSQPRWSPDGRTLAFASDRGGDRQLWLIDRFGGEARQLTHMRGGAGNPVWSPDGKRIAFSSLVGWEDKREQLTSPKTEADKKAIEKKAKDEARVFTKMAWRADSSGIKPEAHAQIWVVDVSEAGQPATAPIQVTWGSYDHGDPQWSPDGKLIAFTAKRSDDEHGRFVDVFTTPVPTCDHPACKATPAPLAPGAKAPEGDEAKAIAEGCSCAAKEAEAAFNPTNITGSRGFLFGGTFSPDGKTIACIGHENEYENATQAKIYLFPVAGGEPRILDHWDLAIGDTVGADLRSGGGGVDVTWAPDGNMIYVPVSERGACSVYAFPVVGGKPQLVAGGNREIAGGTFDRNCETLAFVAGDMFNVGDIYVMDCREFEEKRLTDVNADLNAQIEWPTVEELNFKAPDGWDLHGWVMKPVGFEAGKQYPLVLDIHGGPATCYGYAFYQEMHVLAAAGYGVLFINPRGSTSYGQKFVDAVRGDYGNRDYKDLMSAVDLALTWGWVDEKRLAVTGGSYGGYMTNWIVTQTDRFAAAITHRSICNWISFAGTPDFGPFFDIGSHKVQDPWSPEGVEALWNISPLKYVKNVKTPLSIMHSEFDYRCPIEQGEQFYMAIKFYKQAPVELVRHPRSNHDLTRQGPPVLRVDRFNRMLKWFGKYAPVNA